MDELEKKLISLKKKVDPKPARDSSRTNYSQLLIDLISGLFVGFLLGFWLDKYLNTLPVFLFTFIILGTCGGFYNFYKHLKKMEQKDED